MDLNVDDLKNILEQYHSKDCWAKTINWFKPFKGNLVERAKFLRQVMYTNQVLTPQNTNHIIGDFNVLQGDVIKTKAAITNNPVFSYDPLEYSYYIVIPSSCSVQEGRYKWILLARLEPIEEITDSNKNTYENVLKFNTVKLYYLPPIEGVEIGRFGFFVIFEEISYIANELLQTSSRIASLSEIGWHLFNAFIVNHLTRPSLDDFKVRQSAYPKQWSI